MKRSTQARARALLPARPDDAHKGTFGKVLVVAGSLQYPGAASLATAGAARVGAGLVTLAIGRSGLGGPGRLRRDHASARCPRPIGTCWARARPTSALKHLDGYQALLVGPGIGREEPTRAVPGAAAGARFAAPARRISASASARAPRSRPNSSAPICRRP